MDEDRSPSYRRMFTSSTLHLSGEENLLWFASYPWDKGRLRVIWTVSNLEYGVTPRLIEASNKVGAGNCCICPNGGLLPEFERPDDAVANG